MEPFTGADQDAASRDGGHLIAAVFSASSDAVIVVDASGSIVLSSAAVTTLFGYYPEELVGEPIELLVPDAYRGTHVQHREEFVRHDQSRQMGSGLQLFGRTRDGREIPIDVSLNSTTVEGRRYVAAFVRDATMRLRTMRQMEAVNEVTGLLLSGASATDSLGLIMERARELVDAAAAWIVTPTNFGPFVVTEASGPGTESIIGIEISESASRSALVMASGETEVLNELSIANQVPEPIALLGLGPAAYVPLAAEGHGIGVLVVARPRGARAFDSFETNLVGLFADAAAVALVLADARRELDRLQLIEEDERIARDLHDTVIQRAFGIGMSLEAVRRLASGPVLERIDAAVRSLDEMVRDLRNSIFRLSHPAATDGLRMRLFTLANELAEQLGFRARVATTGPVDAMVDADLAEELLAVCREALTNVARHAKASEADVVVSAESGVLTLTVRDDGVGINEAPTAGNGLGNLASRAERLGGRFDAVRAEPAGTLLSWSVPIPK